MNQDPKRHHYIPEFFAKRWCVPEKLTRYVRTPRGVYCKEFAPKAVGFRTDLYKLKGFGVPNPYGIETHTYQQLDSETSLVLAKLLKSNREEPSDDDACTLSLFLLALPARNPWSLLRGEKIARDAHMAELNSDPTLAAALKVPNGQRLFDAIDLAMPHFMADQTRRVMVEVWSDVSRVERIMKMQWLCLDLAKASGDLVLGDRPLIRHGDLLNGRCVLALPLSPTRLLFVTDMPEFVENLGRQADDDIVRMMNRDSTFHAKEHIFATGRQHIALAEELLAKSKNEPE